MYAFAYQVLGYVMFEKKRLRIDGQIIAEFDRHLRQYAYEKLFHDLPDAERVFLYALGEAPNGEIAHIIKTLGVKNQDISPTRDRLLRKGIIVSPEWGKLKFALPRFKEFLDAMRDFIKRSNERKKLTFLVVFEFLFRQMLHKVAAEVAQCAIVGSLRATEHIHDVRFLEMAPLFQSENHGDAKIGSLVAHPALFLFLFRYRKAHRTIIGKSSIKHWDSRKYSLFRSSYPNVISFIPRYRL